MAAPTPAGRALLVPMMDFPPEFEDETNLFYDYDHIPDRLSCSGIQSCRRLELSSVEPAGWKPDQRWTKYMHVYDLASIDVLDSDEYKLQKTLNGGKGSYWRQLRERRQAAAGAVRDRAMRTSWLQVSTPWSSSRVIEYPEPRVYLIHLRHDAGTLQDAVDDFVDGRLIPEMLTLPGIVGCERFVAAAHTFAKAKNEPSTVFRHPKYLDIFEVPSAEVLVSGTYRRFVDSLNDVDDEVLSAWTPAGSGVYFQRPSPWRVTVR